MTKKQLSKSIIFVLILVLCLLGINRALFPFSEHDTNQTKTFYETEENSVDVLFLGTSLMMMSVNPLRVYDDTGIVTYNRACSCQSPQIAYLTLEETLETQSPKVVVLAAGALIIPYDYEFREPFLRRGMDYKKFSWTKYEAAKDISKQSGGVQTVQSYFFPLLRYHARWGEVLVNGIDSFDYEYDYLHGYYATTKVVAQEDISGERMVSSKAYEVDENTRYWYGRIIELCKENDIEVLAVGNFDLRWTAKKHTVIEAYCEEMGIDFIDYNYEPLKSQLGIDLEKDMYDLKHTNIRGSLKVTDSLSYYIRDKYNLAPSKTSDNVKKQFEEDISQFKADIAKYNKKGFDVSW